MAVGVDERAGAVYVRSLDCPHDTTDANGRMGQLYEESGEYWGWQSLAEFVE